MSREPIAVISGSRMSAPAIGSPDWLPVTTLQRADQQGYAVRTYPAGMTLEVFDGARAGIPAAAPLRAR